MLGEIKRLLAELHGGHLILESAVDEGTTITLLLPEQAHDKDATRAAANLPANLIAEGKRVP